MSKIPNLDSAEDKELSSVIKKASEIVNNEKKEGNDIMDNKLQNLTPEELAALGKLLNNNSADQQQQPMINLGQPSLTDSLITIGKYAGTALLGGLGYKFIFGKKGGVSSRDAEEMAKGLGELFRK